jgi:hypothetical protein
MVERLLRATWLSRRKLLLTVLLTWMPFTLLLKLKLVVQWFSLLYLLLLKARISMHALLTSWLLSWVLHVQFFRLRSIV